MMTLTSDDMDRGSKSKAAAKSRDDEIDPLEVFLSPPKPPPVKSPVEAVSPNPRPLHRVRLAKPALPKPLPPHERSTRC
jgi:hypothetical protein